MAKFDLGWKQHVADTKPQLKYLSYLGKNIQNEVIDCSVGETVEGNVNKNQQINNSK